MIKMLRESAFVFSLLALSLLLHVFRSFSFHFFLSIFFCFSWLDWHRRVVMLLSPIFHSLTLFLLLLHAIGFFSECKREIWTFFNELFIIIISKWNATSTNQHCKYEKSKICHFSSHYFCYFPPLRTHNIGHAIRSEVRMNRVTFLK